MGQSQILYLKVLCLPLLCFRSVWGRTPDKTPICITGFDTVIQEAIFVNLTNEDIYKKWMRPLIHDQVLVNSSIEMYSLASVNERESEFTINVLIDLMWTDPRLISNDSYCEQLTDLSIEGSEWHLNRIWSPKLRIPNNKNPSSMDRDAKIILLRVSANGFVRVRKRLNLDLYCQMNFRYYPFDKQQCEVKFISSDLSEEYLELDWTTIEAPFTFSNNSYISGYSLVGHQLESGSTVSKNENFSSVTIVFFFKRDWSHYILDVFLPSILVICVSWISFWLEITAIPARVFLGATTMLTFVTVAKESREDLPNISYISALDIWFVVCTVFIFFSLIEFLIVAYISRSEKKHMKNIKTIRRNLSQSQMSLSSNETQIMNVNDVSFLCPPKSPSLATRFNFDNIEIKVPKSPSPPVKDMSFKLSMPPQKRVKMTLTPPESPNLEVESKSVSPGSVTIKKMPIEIAVQIDIKCRYCFPIAFFIFVLGYFIVIFTR